MKVVAVIGCGRISQSHFPALEKIDGVRVKYACDLIEEKAQRAKEKYPKVENVITDYKIALADPEVEVVWVLTPNYAHYTVTMDALRAGKHVFCEKPITVNYELSKEMADEANKRGLMLNIGVCNRYVKSVEHLAELNREGKFGKLYHVYASFRGFRSTPGLGGPFTTKEQSGGGVLIDWGVHFFDLIMYILGEDTKLLNLTADAYGEVSKDMKNYKHNVPMWAEDTSDIENGTMDVEDFITGYIRTNNASISFNGAWAQNINKDEMFIDFMGDKGGARLKYGSHFEFYDGETLETITYDYKIPNKMLCEDIAFLEAIETGVKSRSHVDNVLITAKLMQGLYDSSEQKKEISFE